MGIGVVILFDKMGAGVVILFKFVLYIGDLGCMMYCLGMGGSMFQWIKQSIGETGDVNLNTSAFKRLIYDEK